MQNETKKPPVEMVGPCGRVMVPAKEVETYKGRGFEVAPKDKPLKPTVRGSKSDVVEDGGKE